MKIRLPVRLFLSYLAVALVGALVSFLTIRALAPRLFEQRIGMMNGVFNGQGGMRMGRDTAAREDVHAAFLSALNTALLVGALASALMAGLVAAVVTSRLLRPLDAVRAATRQIAAGRYEARVPAPAEPELAALAGDVNTLGSALAETETRRVRLLGEVAHEMRTPLTALDGYVEGLIDGVFKPDPETLGALGDELRRLHRLADDLSTLSRAEERRLELKLAPTDLAVLGRRAAERLAPQFADAGVTLSVDAAAPAPVTADPDRIVQVLTNLLGNALKATPAGGVVELSVAASGGQAVATVRDSGVGLAAADLERVFERFYRVPGQPRRSGGSGIGLTIARGIARGHGGELTASSPGPGRGATFTLTLPASTRQADAPTPDKPENAGTMTSP